MEMIKKYPHLLSPLRIGDVVLKNRMVASPSRPHFIQGPEPYPTEATILHYANKAKAGAALVVCGCGFSHGPPKSVRGLTKNTMVGHYVRFDIYDSLVQHYLSQLAETIHFYGAKASLQIGPSVPEGYDVSTDVPPVRVMGDEGAAGFQGSGLEMPVDVLNEVAEDMVLQALIAKSCGFDGVYIHMAYRASLFGRFLSPRTNKRADRYGGSLENRARFPLEVCERIKQACGRRFLIETSITGYDPQYWSLDDTVRFAKMAEGKIDMLQLRPWDIELTHPTGFDIDPTPWVFMCEAVKKSGSKVAVVAIGGFTHPDYAEEALASGRADLIAMARAWISNPDFGIKVYEGRVDEIVPCIRCNRCHRSSWFDPWISVCSVNPIWGMEHLVDKLVKPPAVKKKVAVIGGGPAGMKAALVASERGHKVTLFEGSDQLGGLLKTSDYVSFKWPIRDFKDFLIRQIRKSSIDLCLNTRVKPSKIIDDGYDAAIIAIGSEPIIPQIPGVEGKNVVKAVDVYGREDSMGERIVIIGGGEVGVETGIHLAQKGYKTTILEMRDKLAPEAAPIHYRSVILMAIERQENLKYILNARCTRILSDGAVYVDGDGREHLLEADNVVLAVGMKPKVEEAFQFVREFADAKVEFHLIGDCAHERGNIQKAVRSAFAAASTI